MRSSKVYAHACGFMAHASPLMLPGSVRPCVLQTGSSVTTRCTSYRQLFCHISLMKGSLPSPGGCARGSAQSAHGSYEQALEEASSKSHITVAVPLFCARRAASTREKFVVSCFTKCSTCFRSTPCLTAKLLRCTMRRRQREASSGQPHRRLSLQVLAGQGVELPQLLGRQS